MRLRNDRGLILVAAKKPRKHHHLSRESIARAALEIIDAEGIEAFSLRRLAQSLEVSTMSVYTYTADRDAIIRDVVALLLSEVEHCEDGDVPWEEAVLFGSRSLQAMARRHPRAWPLVALASYDEWPLSEYGRRVDERLVRQGVPDDLLPILGSMLDAYATGFLLLEAQALAAPTQEAAGPFDLPPEPPAATYTVTHPDEAFEEGIRSIVAGVKARYGATGADAARRDDR